MITLYLLRLLLPLDCISLFHLCREAYICDFAMAKGSFAIDYRG
jgi:hypothetical protein